MTAWDENGLGSLLVIGLQDWLQATAMACQSLWLPKRADSVCVMTLGARVVSVPKPNQSLKHVDNLKNVKVQDP